MKRYLLLIFAAVLLLGVIVVFLTRGGQIANIFSSSQSLFAGNVELNNEYNDKELLLNRSGKTFTTMRDNLSALNINELNQVITIKKGFPSVRTQGAYTSEGAKTSALTFELKNNTIYITLYLKEDLTEDAFKFELARTYFHAILALDEYQNSLKIGKDPDYQQVTELVLELTTNSKELDDYPLYVEN